MGWKLVKASRDKLLSEAHAQQEPGKCKTTVVDMCAEGRRQAVGQNPRSARAVSKSICTSLWKKTSDLVVFLYDDASRMHAARDDLHRQRYRPMTSNAARKAVAAGKVLVDGQAYAPNMLPYTPKEIALFTDKTPIVWPRLWSSKHGKKKAFDLLEDGCVWWHHQNATFHKFVSWSAGKPLSYPYTNKDLAELSLSLCNNYYGEADNKVQMAVEVLQQQASGQEPDSIMIITIDTDMIIQMVAADIVPAPGTLWLHLLNETIDIGRLCKVFGSGNRTDRLTSVVLLLCSAGVDYCRGLGFLGFGSAELGALARTPSKFDFLRLDFEARRAKLLTRKFLSVLSTCQRRKIRGFTWEEFSSEIHSIIFCASLFAGADRLRQPAAGPDKTSGHLFPARAGPFLSSDLGGVAECVDVEFSF